MSVNPSQFDALRRSLDAAAIRHRVLSQNLANINTPGYQRLDVRFEDLLDERIGDDRRLSTGALSEVHVDPDAQPRADGNSVDVDIELAEVNKNSLAAQTYIQILASKLQIMRTAITGQ